MLKPYLEDLERRIDPQIEDKLYQEWKDFTNGKFTAGIFCPQRSTKSPPNMEWPKVRVNQTLDNYELMALQQLRACSVTLETGTGALMCVRSNYGTGILPSLFGTEIFIMADEIDTLPTNRPLAGGMAKIKDLLQRDLPQNRTGLGGKTLEMVEYFETLFAKYPRIKKYVHHYHPDLQSPMNVCELLWGSSLFVDLYDEPDLVKALLERVTQTYIQFLTEWTRIVPFHGDYAVHWSLLHRGHIVLRDDSAMNLSPEMFGEFIQPYNQRLFDTFGGGMDHFCGRGDHFIAKNSGIRGLYAIDMTQPEYNNMEVIYRHTVDKGILLLSFNRIWADKALAEGQRLHGRVHCWW